VKVPKLNFLNVSSQFCNQAKLHSKKCITKCNLRDASDDDEQFQDDSITFQQYQFYVFVLLMVGSFAGTAVTTTLSDTICVAKSKLNPIAPISLYSVRGLERSELGGSHGCPGRLWDRFL